MFSKEKMWWGIAIICFMSGFLAIVGYCLYIGPKEIPISIEIGGFVAIIAIFLFLFIKAIKRAVIESYEKNIDYFGAIRETTPKGMRERKENIKFFTWLVLFLILGWLILFLTFNTVQQELNIVPLIGYSSALSSGLAFLIVYIVSFFFIFRRIKNLN